jgi:hypothetical protein
MNRSSHPKNRKFFQPYNTKKTDMSIFNKMFKNQDEKPNQNPTESNQSNENLNDNHEELNEEDDDIIEEDEDNEEDEYDEDYGLLSNIEPQKDKVIGTGKSAGLGQPGELPVNYNPDSNNPLTVYRNVAGCSRDDIWSYMMAIDKWDWSKYNYKEWPCADLSFPDLDQNKSYDLWPFKKDLKLPHWIDLNKHKSGIARKGTILGYETPDQYVGKDAQKNLVIFENLEKQSDILIKEAGFKDKEHLLYIIDYTKNEIKKAYAEAQSVLDESKGKLDGMMQKNIEKVKGSGLLDPINGVSLDDWAAANAKIAGGMPVKDVLKVLNIEKPSWDEVSAEWMARMSQDSTFAISKVYGDAFVNPNIGKFASSVNQAASSSSPSSEKVKNDLDLYIKIMCHQNIGSTQGIDAATILKMYDLSALDWSMISSHWGPQLAGNLENAMKMSSLMEKYNTEFAASAPPKAGNDIDF